MSKVLTDCAGKNAFSLSRSQPMQASDKGFLESLMNHHTLLARNMEQTDVFIECWVGPRYRAAGKFRAGTVAAHACMLDLNAPLGTPLTTPKNRAHCRR